MGNKNIDWEDEFVKQKADNKELLHFVGRVLANWYWFVLCGLIGISLAFLYVRYTIPTYKINAKLLVSDDKKGGLMGMSALADLSGLMGVKSSVDNEVEILKTADLMSEMVRAEEAYVNYYKQGSVHDIPILEAPFQIRFLSSPDSISEPIQLNVKSLGKKHYQLSNKDTIFEIGEGQRFVLPSIGNISLVTTGNEDSVKEQYGFSISPINKTVAGLMESLSVEVTNKNVSTIDLSLLHPIPKKGELLLGSLIDRYVERNLNDKNVVMDSTLSFINQRLRKITDELAGVEDRISGYKQATKLADISEQSKILLQSSETYIRGLAEVETQLAMLDAVSNYLKDTKNPRVVPSSVILQDVAFNALVTRYNELVLQRERLLMGNTEENPLVQNMTAQIAGLREDMINNVASTRRQLELTKNNQNKLANQVNSQIQQVPTIERGYIDLARLQQIKQAQYIFLQEKWEENAIARTANVSNSKLIDSPKAEEKPIAPKGKVIYIIGLVLGTLVPFGFIYLRDLFNIKVNGFVDVQSLSKLPVLGMISHSDTSEQVVVTKTSRSAIAEQFRAMRTNLEFALNGGKTILFSSSMSGEGKSYVALNLAVSLALLDKKVLLMELDLRKPSITAKLGLAPGKGFSHYIVRPEMAINDIIMPSGTHDLVHLVQAGIIPPNPAELLISDRANILMNELKEMYDYIIIDAPPVGLVTDAQLLSRYADTCLYLIRQGYTHKEQLRIPNDLVTHKKINNIQLIINDVHVKKGYYGNYGYGYGYGDYGQEKKKRKFWKWF
ncbi:GumC family protein [Sphingobacterium sp. MYb382]|uniref:GumC family protein n=1 Tax=Sphingobacterium sp. MYb382 TaxID=2745278 RepID=UPI0030ACE24E